MNYVKRAILSLSIMLGLLPATCIRAMEQTDEHEDTSEQLPKNLLNQQLLQAAELGYVSLVETLIDQGADINHHNRYDPAQAKFAYRLRHRGPVVYGTIFGPRIIEQRDHVKYTHNPSDWTALMHATYTHQPAIVQILIDAGAIVNLHVHDNESALQILCRLHRITRKSPCPCLADRSPSCDIIARALIMAGAQLALNTYHDKRVWQNTTPQLRTYIKNELVARTNNQLARILVQKNPRLLMRAPKYATDNQYVLAPILALVNEFIIPQRYLTSHVPDTRKGAREKRNPKEIIYACAIL